MTPTGTYGVEGRSFNYRKTKKLAIDSKLAAKATIDELIKLSGSNKQLLFNEIGADLEVVYDKLKVGGLEIEANYSEWSLKQTTIDRINEAPDFEDCRKKLKERNWAFITDIALIKYTISLNGENVKKFGATINAKLKREGVNVDIGALIEKEVHKSLTAQTVQGYQIIGWRKSKIE